MLAPVKLYVYDLSRGMARQLSQQFTGRHIDGIWHTSVVVFGKEIFYGMGISVTLPGRSHHGSPLRVIDMGETALDEETFNEYLTQMREHYTADKYHLLEFNCNSFSSDCIGFLTGQSIPEYIKDLPSDFLSTPLGQALRPTIDAMFRRTSEPLSIPTPPIPAENADLATSVLHNVTSQVQAAPPEAAAQTLSAPVHVTTNPASFQSFLRMHRAAVAFFTNKNCGPCNMIDPVYERLAEEKGVKSDGSGVGFAKIDIGVGLGNHLASEWGIRATPTFIFFLDGNKTGELKGANAAELRSQIDLLIFQAFPPHPHLSIPLPAVEALSLDPILFSQVPAFDTVLGKLSSFIDSATEWPSSVQPRDDVKQTLKTIVVPYLKARFSTPVPSNQVSATQTIVDAWNEATSALAAALPPVSLFPLVDLWRLALLDPAVNASVSLSLSSSASNAISTFLPKAGEALHTPASRNYLLTSLRLVVNAFSTPALGQKVLSRSTRKEATSVLIPSLLHEDAGVRTAAASLMFNFAALVQKGRVEKVRGNTFLEMVPEDEDWEVELVSAVIEALDRETASEAVVHRLTASLAFLLRLSPWYETQICPLLEVLQARVVLQRKLEKGGCGETGITKEAKKLIEEVALKLCP